MQLRMPGSVRIARKKKSSVRKRSCWCCRLVPHVLSLVEHEEIRKAKFPYEFLQSSKKLKLPALLPSDMVEQEVNLIGSVQVDAIHAILMTPMALIGT